jgi:hypothetical protein
MYKNNNPWNIGPKEAAINQYRNPSGGFSSLRDMTAAGQAGERAESTPGHLKGDIQETAWMQHADQIAGGIMPYYNQWNAKIQGDPRMQQYQGMQDRTFGRAAGGIQRFNQRLGANLNDARNFLGNDMQSLRRAAYGKGQSLTDQYGLAQRQMAQGDIAKQAAMNARGGMSAADRRNAIMQSSNVGANMAAQLAEQRTAERQQAMQRYLMAQQARRDAVAGATGHMGAGVDARSNLYNMANAGLAGEAGRVAGTYNMGAGAFGTESDAWGNLTGMGGE